MGFCFSSPKKKDILADNGETINTNARTLSVCVELCDGEVKKSVERVYDAVRYMTPTTVAGAIAADKKIGALAGDLKIVLSKSSRTLDQAEDIVKNIELAIAERNSYLK